MVLIGIFLKVSLKLLGKNSSAFPSQMNDDIQEFLTCLQPEKVDVSFEWECFLIFIDKLMRLSMSKVNPSMSESAYFDARKSLKQKGIEGAFMKRILRNSKRCNPILTKGDMFLVKLRKRVARSYELKRVLCQRTNEGPCLKIDRICGTLIQKLQLGDQGWSLRFVISAIRSAKVELETAENKTRQLRHTCWKNRFCADVKFAGQWLKKRDACVEVNVHTSEGACASRQDAVNQICDFWTNFSSLAHEAGPSVSEIGRQLVANAVCHDTRWSDLEGVHFSRIAVDMKGSAGGDGWTGLDLSRFPPAFLGLVRFDH